MIEFSQEVVILYWWEKSEYTIGSIKVFNTPDDQKNYKVMNDTRTLQEKLAAFEAEFKKEEPLIIRG